MSGWVLVTGAARRIGRGIARDLAQAGYDIVVHYHQSAEEAASLAHDIQSMGRAACLAEIDLADEKPVARLIPQLVAELGPLTALVNNASLFEPDPGDPDGTRHDAVNYAAPRLLSEAFFAATPALATPKPCIVNLLDADPSKPQFTAYNRSKIALAALTKDLARRFAPALRVNGVALGPLLPSPRESREHFDAMLAATPLQTPLAPESVAAAVRFLIENPAVTGDIIHIDGGSHLR